MTTPIKFGTDGWRGIIAEDFTFDNVRVCTQGVIDYVKRAGLAHRGLIVGYDTRFASEDFATAAAEVAAANDIKVYLCQQTTPTPIIGHAVLMKEAAGAIIITASHNPASWNGFKYRLENATSASPQVIAELEKRISEVMTTRSVKHIPLEQAMRQGLVERFDPSPSYLQHIAGLVDLERLRHSGLRVVVDSMYGAGAGYFRSILGGGSTEVTEIHNERNPLFPGIRPEPIPPNLAELSTMVKRNRASVGLATDGDADRLGIVDEKGNFLTQLQVFALLCLYLLEVREERGAMVRTITSTTMIDRLGEIFNVPVYETAVGFKYVAPIMMAKDAIIGGEESGGYGFRGHMPERDGILAGIYFLDFMLQTGKTPSQLLDYLYSKVGPHYYQRRDFSFPKDQRQAITKSVGDNLPQSIDGVKVTKINTSDGFHLTLADTSWLLIRFSGTEPVLRVYAESNSQARVEKLLEVGRKLAGV